MNLKPHKPYNDLPELPPKQAIETTAVLKRCITAHKEIAKLSQASELIPDQSVLINTIPLLEAKASSEIENIVTTNDALFREASQPGDNSSAETKEALRYRSALLEGLASLKSKPLTTNTAVQICSAIKNVDMKVRDTPGTALQNKSTGEIIYTPPVGEALLRQKLANWENFINRHDDVDALVRMAVQHYQFEAIHPFIDGNGRTGRILNVLVIIQAELLTIPTLYLSRYILQTRAEYYRRLSDVTRKNDWESWILYMLQGVEETAAWTNIRIHAIRDLMNHTADFVRDQDATAYSHELIQAIFALPYVRIATLIDRGIAKRATATRNLRRLVDLGVLQEQKDGRSRLFIHRKFMDLLESESHAFEPYATTSQRAKKSIPTPRERKKI